MLIIMKMVDLYVFFSIKKDFHHHKITKIYKNYFLIQDDVDVFLLNLMIMVTV
jgi:hypothetical protein